MFFTFNTCNYQMNEVKKTEKRSENYLNNSRFEIFTLNFNSGELYRLFPTTAISLIDWDSDVTK